ncbi:hypothetical protein Q0Z83_022190 [Actinoplanes sichuanensis]|uniref:Aminoglycoside phosphotransferase domain-containing protein n=1 Tax=Actinoplanes sichuanensis TaxID=512349 RepID=A0ABW4AJK4_9ACTN|nr:hypothetical protein [Actinoplanes sichuanensis]BEL04028.1 hypothetical protein Q0Z83_022190 [Actinoplanes sichuanensis]
MRADWPGTGDTYVSRLAAARAAFHPDEIRDGWLAVGRDNRPTAAGTGTAVSFRLSTDGGTRVVDCFLGPPGDGIRDRCRHLSALTGLPDEVVVPRWYDGGVTVDEQDFPILVHTEQSGPTLADRLPALAEEQVGNLLERWLTLRDDLARRFDLHHAGPDPRLVFLPDDQLATVRVTGWENPPGDVPGADRLAQALRDRLTDLNPVPVVVAEPPARGRSVRTIALVMAAALTLCVAGLVALWVI